MRLGDGHDRLDVERPLGPRVGKGRVAPCVALAREATMGQPTPATLTGWGSSVWAAGCPSSADRSGSDPLHAGTTPGLAFPLDDKGLVHLLHQP